MIYMTPLSPGIIRGRELIDEDNQWEIIISSNLEQRVKYSYTRSERKKFQEICYTTDIMYSFRYV
jgi:hypothetical protein